MCVCVWNSNSAKVEGVHKEFQKAVRAGVCRFIPETGNLVLISWDDSSQKRASMIQEMHFRNLSQKVECKKKRKRKIVDHYRIHRIQYEYFVRDTGPTGETH